MWVVFSNDFMSSHSHNELADNLLTTRLRMYARAHTHVILTKPRTHMEKRLDYLFICMGYFRKSMHAWFQNYIFFWVKVEASKF